MNLTPEVKQKLIAAMEEKYGKSISIEDFYWTQAHEIRYLVSVKILEQRILRNTRKPDKQKLFTKRNCKICGKYILDLSSNVYMTKYNCCEGCYIQHREGRDKWTEHSLIKFSQKN